MFRFRLLSTIHVYLSARPFTNSIHLTPSINKAKLLARSPTSGSQSISKSAHKIFYSVRRIPSFYGSFDNRTTSMFRDVKTETVKAGRINGLKSERNSPGSVYENQPSEIDRFQL